MVGLQTFKQALRKSDRKPQAALQEFLMQYRRTPLSGGFSPSELLNGRQIRTKIDILLPSPPHAAQRKQVVESQRNSKTNNKDNNPYSKEMKVYTLVCNKNETSSKPRLIPATVVKILGPRSVTVRVTSSGQVWRRHVDQLRPRHENPARSGDGALLGKEVDNEDLSLRQAGTKRTRKPKVPYDV